MEQRPTSLLVLLAGDGHEDHEKHCYESDAGHGFLCSLALYT